MDIGIIGAGSMGAGMGEIWAQKGHRVCFSYSRDPARLAVIAQAAGNGARAGTPEEAADFGEVVLLAVPWPLALDLVANVGSRLAGKTLIICVVPWNGDRSGLSLANGTSAAEEIARQVPAANVVEALGVLSDALCGAPCSAPDRASMFYCGDCPVAKAAVSDLIEDLALDPVDAGALRIARYLEPMAALLQHLAVGQGQGMQIALKLLR